MITADGVFYLFYARRNVWMEGPGGVYAVAEGLGLRGVVVGAGTSTQGGEVGEAEGIKECVEPIYAFTFV